jgi:sugar lactone lactonase YvrE
MKKVLIYIIVVVLGLLILVIILGDFMSGEIKDSESNPYAYEFEEFKAVDPSLIKFKEARRIGLNIEGPKAIDVKNGLIAIAYKDHLQVIDSSGLERINMPVNGPLTAVSFSPEGNIYLAGQNSVQVLSPDGETIARWEDFGEKTLITAIAFKDTVTFLADAGNRKVFRLNLRGEILGSFDGTGRLDGNYGFILPSPYFDLEVDPDDQLWVVNSGLLKLENYTDEGSVRAFWGKPSFEIEGFTGCCNPAHIAIMEDGSFVTSEKGISRIKVYKPSGELDCVVATPDDFEDDSEPADIAVDEFGKIYVLDITSGKIRIFERNII